MKELYPILLKKVLQYFVAGVEFDYNVTMVVIRVAIRVIGRVRVMSKP